MRRPRAPKVSRPKPDSLFWVDESEGEDVAIEKAQRSFLLAKTDDERDRALEDMLRLDSDEAEDLQDLDPEGLAEERLEAAVEDALNKFHLSGTDDERWRAYEELKRLDPDEAEDLFN